MNPPLLSAVVEVQVGHVTRTTIVDGSVTRLVVAVTTTRICWLSITETQTRTTFAINYETVSSITTVRPLTWPTPIGIDHDKKVDFGFSPAMKPGNCDKAIPMPEHSCPRDA